MEDFIDAQHICSPLLYVFKADLIRIGQFIKGVLQNINIYTGYGKLYGLYTHSRAAVVHITTLRNLNQRQLQDMMSNKVKVKENVYNLSLVGEWFTVHNSTISARELLRKKADTLNGSETYFCFVVEKVKMKSRYEDISKFIQAFFLTKDKIYKIDMKILNRESPFRLDVDVTEKISLAEYVDEEMYTDDSKEFVSNGNEYLGTELKEMLAVSKTVQLNSENSLNRNENELFVLKNESVNEHIGKDDLIDSNCIEVKKNANEFGTAGQKEAKYSTSNNVNDLWVVIKPSDVLNAEPHSRTKEVPIQAVTGDGKQEDTTIDGSIAEKDSTFENKFNTVCDDAAQRSDKNDEKESGNIKAEDNQVANEKILSIEEVSVNTVLPDVEKKTVATEAGVDSHTEEQEEINPAEHSSLTEIKGNTTRNDGELGAVYSGEGKTDTGGSIHEENLTTSDDKNGKNIIHNGPRQSEKNEIGESEGTIARDGGVASGENEEKLTTVVSVDEEGKITENDGESVAEERVERKSTVEVAGKDKIEDVDDVGRDEEKLQDIENDERHDKKSTQLDGVTAENKPKIGGGKFQEIENGGNNEFSMGTLENSLSAEESSDDHNKIDNEEQKNTSPKDEHLPQEEAVDDTSVGTKNEYVVEQSKQNHSEGNCHEISSVPCQENHFTHKDHK